MKLHSKEQFNCFLSQLSETNATLSYFCDFDKIDRNVGNIEISLNMMDYLIGKEDMRKAVQILWDRDKSVFRVLGILIAVRDGNRRLVLNNVGEYVTILDYSTSVDKIMAFLSETGLMSIFQSRKIKSLKDYVFGVETGLDTNARKNRVGKTMEKYIAHLFTSNGIPYQEQVRYEIENLGEDIKVFDFLVQTKEKTYLIEVNYYNSGGSKLNEVARSYTDLAPKINANENLEFIWITDGIGWNSAKNKLEEAFNTISSVYNLTSIIELIEKIKTELE